MGKARMLHSEKVGEFLRRWGLPLFWPVNKVVIRAAILHLHFLKIFSKWLFFFFFEIPIRLIDSFEHITACWMQWRCQGTLSDYGFPQKWFMWGWGDQQGGQWGGEPGRRAASYFYGLTLGGKSGHQRRKCAPQLASPRGPQAEVFIHQSQHCLLEGYSWEGSEQVLEEKAWGRHLQV